MKIKNRTQLLACLRAKAFGYTGPAELAAVDKFVADEGIELIDADGPINIKSVWETKARLVDPGDEDESKEADRRAKDLADREAELETKRAALDAETKKHKDDEKAANEAARGKSFGRVAVHTGARKAHGKAYNARVAAGKAMFGDADQAEYIGATLRLASINPFKAKGVTYGEQENDESIVRNVLGEDGVRGKAGTTTTNTTYGFFIPEEVTNAIMYATEPAGVMRKLVQVVKMNRDTWGGTRKTAIVSMSHVSEAGTISASDNTYDRVQLTAKEVGCIVRLSNSLLEDSAVNIAEEYARTFVEAQQIREDKDIILGDGSATYGGHVGLANSLPSGAYIAQATSNTWSAQVEADFLAKICGVVENCDTSRLAFLASRQYFFQVMLRIMQGKSGNNVGDTVKSVGMVKADAQFLGYPVYFSQQMPLVTTTTAKGCFFGDFMGGVTLGDRRELRVDTSEHIYFTTDEYAIRATARIAVNVHSDGRAGTYGNIVCLKNG